MGFLTPEQLRHNADQIRAKPTHRELRERPGPVHPPVGVAVYVAVDGDDANPGTLDKPLRSLRAARDLIRNRRVDTQNAAVYVRGGIYRLTETLELDARDSYTTWAAFPGEAPVLSGGLQLKDLRWAASDVHNNSAVLMADVELPTRPEKYNNDNNIFRAGGGHDWGRGPALINQLFSNGTRLVRARYPNGNPQDNTGKRTMVHTHQGGTACGCRVMLLKDATEQRGLCRVPSVELRVLSEVLVWVQVVSSGLNR